MGRFRIATIALLALGALGSQGSAQGLTISLFERYLESLRVRAGIPGLSAAIVQDGRVVWDRGFGYQDVEASIAATATTPYPITDLSQTLASTLLLQRCYDSGRLEFNDRVRRWISDYPERETTVAQLMMHEAPTGGFQYDAARYAVLSGVVEQCTSDRYPRVLTGEILDRLGMIDSVPSHDLTAYRSLFPAGVLERYRAVVSRLATPYRVGSDGRPVRSDYLPRRLDASTGVVSTARDLARFDAALGEGVLVSPEALRSAWTVSASTPTGLGWFVQRYNDEWVVWHFGLANNAYSSLVLKVPGRRLTLILLANSDDLTAPYSLSDGDVTASLFATLPTFVPRVNALRSIGPGACLALRRRVPTGRARLRLAPARQARALRAESSGTCEGRPLPVDRVAGLDVPPRR